MTRAEEVIEALDPLAIGEEVWFVWSELDGSQMQKRGVVKQLVCLAAGGGHVDSMAVIATGPERPTMPSYQVCFDDITRDK